MALRKDKLAVLPRRQIDRRSYPIPKLYIHHPYFRFIKMGTWVNIMACFEKMLESIGDTECIRKINSDSHTVTPKNDNASFLGLS